MGTLRNFHTSAPGSSEQFALLWFAKKEKEIVYWFIICLFPFVEFVYMILLNLHGWGTKYLS